MKSSDTIFAPATPPGKGAVSIVRISGGDAFSLTDRIVAFRNGSASEAKGYSIKYGSIPGLDEVLVAVFRAPHSYTGEDSVEISCHASPYIMGRLLQMLSEAGGRLAEPGEFTRRAFLNGKMDLAQAEAVADMIAADSQAAHRVAVSQLRGHYSEELRNLRDQLVDISSLMELELDFSEEDVEFADRGRLKDLLCNALGHIGKLADSFRLGNAIKNGVPVAIAGNVNSGKSTLLNALAGEDRAIVSDIPGTTRDTVEDTVSIGGVMFRFIDTAGIRNASDSIERIGIERSFAAIDKAHTVIVVLDGTEGLDELGETVKMLFDRMTGIAAGVASDSNALHGRSAAGPERLIIVRNKIDLPEAAASEAADLDWLAGICGLSGAPFGAGPGTPLPQLSFLDISAKTGSGLEELRRTLAEGISEAGTDASMVTNFRHYEALCAARNDLLRVARGLEEHLPTDLLAEDLRCASIELGTIFGEITTDEVLGSIFERFCIGK